MKKRYVLLLLVLGTFLSFSFQADNLLVNGSFNGDPTYLGWEKIAGGNLSGFTGGKSGTYLWLNGVGRKAEPAIRQLIPGLRVGDSYEISGYYRAGQWAASRCHCPGTPVFSIDLDGRSIRTFAMPEADAGWQPFSVTFTATQSTHALQLRAEINGTQGDVAVDEVSLRPETASWFQLKQRYEGRG